MSQDISPDAGDHISDLLDAETEIDIKSFLLAVIEEFGGLDKLAFELKFQYDETPAGSPGRAAILNNIVKLIHALSSMDQMDDENDEDMEARKKALIREIRSEENS
jgi:hypothetical protein